MGPRGTFDPEKGEGEGGEGTWAASHTACGCPMLRGEGDGSRYAKGVPHMVMGSVFWLVACLL